MITTTLAAADLLDAIPSLFQDAQAPASVAMVGVGTGCAIFALHKGIGHAAGKIIGGIALSVLALGGVGLASSGYETVNTHTHGSLNGHYGR